MSLSTHDARHVTAAQGFLELGMYRDANAELEEIAPEMRAAPEVLSVRVSIYGALEQWEEMLTVAKRLAQVDSQNVQWTVSLAFATRRTESIQAAKAILLAGVERHPEEAVLQYNLACYECQLGELEVAKGRLRHAFNLDPRFRALALDDPDLSPLWDSLGKDQEDS